MEDLIPNDGCVVTVTETGFIKRTSVEEFRLQNRGGKGVIGSGQKDEDPISVLQTCNAHDTLMFIMTNGRVYVEKAYEIPECSRISKGRNIINFLNLQKGEKIASLISVDSFETEKSLVLCTRKGVTKKTKLSAYKNHRKGGIIGINVDEGDAVLNCLLASDDDHLLLVTKTGKGLRFDCRQLRNQGRVTRGVRGMRLKNNDEIANMLVVDDDRLVLLCGKNGLGLRTRFAAFLPNGGVTEDQDTLATPRKRGGQGVTAMNTDKLCTALSVEEDSEILMVTKNGQAVRCPVVNIRETNRGSKGVRLVNLSGKDVLMGVSEVVKIDEDETTTSESIEEDIKENTSEN